MKAIIHDDYSILITLKNKNFNLLNYRNKVK